MSKHLIFDLPISVLFIYKFLFLKKNSSRKDELTLKFKERV